MPYFNETLCLSQYTSDMKNRKYASDSDLYLLNLLDSERKTSKTVEVPTTNATVLILQFHVPAMIFLIISISVMKFNNFDLHNLHNISGNTTNIIMKHCYASCVKFLEEEK